MKTLFNQLIKRPILGFALALLGLAAAPSASAASISSAIAAGTPLTLLSNGNTRVDSVVFINTNASAAASIWFYDSTGNSTTYVRSATTTYAFTTTNISTIFTNSSGIVLTNTTAFITRVPTTVTAATNERPRISPFIVPAGEALTITDVNFAAFRGVTVYSTAAGTINFTYDNIR